MEARFSGTMWTAEHKDGQRFEMSSKEMEVFLETPPKEDGAWCLSEFHEPFGGEQEYYTSRGITFLVDAESVTHEDLVALLNEWTFAAYQIRNEYDCLIWVVLLPMSGPVRADDYDLMIHWLDRLFGETGASGDHEERYPLPNGGDSYPHLVHFSGWLSPSLGVLREEKMIVAEEARTYLLGSIPERDIKEGDFQRLVLAEIRQVKGGLQSYRKQMNYLQKFLSGRLDRIESEIERLTAKIEEQAGRRRGFFG
jgi:hypothetical protein